MENKPQQAVQVSGSSATPSPQSSSSAAGSSSQNSPGKYSELLAVIEELGKDIRPTYAGSKNAAERLKKGEDERTWYNARTGAGEGMSRGN